MLPLLACGPCVCGFAILLSRFACGIGWSVAVTSLRIFSLFVKFEGSAGKGSLGLERTEAMKSRTAAPGRDLA